MWSVRQEHGSPNHGQLFRSSTSTVIPKKSLSQSHPFNTLIHGNYNMSNQLKPLSLGGSQLSIYRCFTWEKEETGRQHTSPREKLKAQQIRFGFHVLMYDEKMRDISTHYRKYEQKTRKYEQKTSRRLQRSKKKNLQSKSPSQWSLMISGFAAHPRGLCQCLETFLILLTGD